MHNIIYFCCVLFYANAAHAEDNDTKVTMEETKNYFKIYDFIFD